MRSLDAPGSTPQDGRVRVWRVLLEWLVFGLTASGAAWLVAKRLLATPTEFGPVAPPWAARVLALHGGIAMLALVVAGAWLQAHVAPRLCGSAGRNSGFLQLGLLIVLISTGFGLYYVAGDSTRPVWSAVHWLSGLALPVILLIHRRLAARHG
jgi:hypothetical protein